jgi:hypothetical protein
VTMSSSQSIDPRCVSPAVAISLGLYLFDREMLGTV